MRNKNKLIRFKLLNPKNLEKEVHVYGYYFSWKKHLLVLICSLLGISAIGILYRLNPVFFAITIAVVVLALPALIVDMYKRMFEQKRFADVTTYMEQILYSFQKNGKIVSALRETSEIFDDGQMKDMICQAIVYLEEGYAGTEKGLLREALDIIEKPYECTKLHTVHNLLISSEDYGGDTEKSIQLLLADIEIWKRRGYCLQAEKKQSHTDNIVSIVVATILCAVALYVLEGMNNIFPQASTESNIFQIMLIQVSSLLFIIFMVCVLVRSTKNLTSNWLKNEGIHNEEYILNSYQTVMSYNDAKENRKSRLFAIPFLIGGIAAFLFRYQIVGIVCILLAAFMLLQHKIGYKLAKKDINNELYIALPEWLMEITLLLQNNNVQISLVKSISGSPAILKSELQALTERLSVEPDKLRSYTDFCKQFDIPEAQSCMKMLHAISESGTGNADIQIANLIQRVNEMQDMADQIKNQSIAFKTKMVFSYPILGATIKLLIDLTFGMIYMFQMLGNMGGI